MPTPDLAHTFESIISAITSGDLDALDPLIRYDIIDHNLIPGQGDGLPGLKYWARTLRTAMPDITATICDTVSETDKMAARVRWAGNHIGELPGAPATHAYIEFESFYILHFTEGRAIKWWDGSDTRESMRHLYRRVRLLEARNTMNSSSTGF
ncbi:ester cyclase [Arthrobacter sp. B1805]|uniref:ester cyclase n=1 Tax=Arthrobacter sp. B1805 TaxID=2058892 RepID=UPI000CE563B4|nr:ester cyclase [Arthrobacter sp. B1805]